jgi:hypothetical protein
MYHNILFKDLVLNILFNYTSVAVTLDACNAIHISNRNIEITDFLSNQTQQWHPRHKVLQLNTTTCACDKKWSCYETHKLAQA